MQTPPESTASNTHLRKALDLKQQRKVYINLKFMFASWILLLCVRHTISGHIVFVQVFQLESF